MYNGQKHIRLYRFDWVPTIGNMKFFATGILPDPEMSKYNVLCLLNARVLPRPRRL